MNIIIFSLNRAPQLELLLRSMSIHFKEFNDIEINILYKYTNEYFKKGYDLIINKYDNTNFILETDFKTDLINLFENSNKQYIMFLMDDNVFKEDFSLEDNEVNFFKNNIYGHDIIALSLRLHPNLTYCYPAKINMRKPNIIQSQKQFFNKNIISWRNETGDYNYTMSLDGNLYRTEQIEHLIHKLNYNNPNSLESNLASNALNIPYLLFYDKSKIINIPINKVQNYNNNIHGDITAEYLNDLFLKGKRISLDGITGIDNISCHQEIDIKYE